MSPFLILVFISMNPGADAHGRMLDDMCGTESAPGRCPECCTTECTKAVEVYAGEPVPCAGGILVPDSMVEDLLLCKEIELPRCSAMLERETGVSSSKMKACNAELSACNGALSKTDKLLERSLENRKKPEWYKNPWMNIAIGVAVGAAITSAAHSW